MPQKLIDLAGRRFGRLTVSHRVPAESGKKPQWVCICDCKTVRIIYGYSLLNGSSASCGCLQREGMAKRRVTHGARRCTVEADLGSDIRVQSSTYASWSAMNTRCCNPKAAGYQNYGGREITVCPRWRGSGGFVTFQADMGDRPLNTSLDRIDNNGNYCAAACGGLCGHSQTNCRWASHRDQMLNRRNIRQFTPEEISIIEGDLNAGLPQEMIACKFGVGRRVIRRLHRDAKAAVIAATAAAPSPQLTCPPRVKLSVDESAVDDLVRTLRQGKFPWPAVTTDASDLLSHVRSARVTVQDNVISYVKSVGQRACLAANPHRFEARHRGHMSVLDAFDDDKILRRVIKYQMERGDPVTPKRIVSALQAVVRAPRNFPPALARWIVDEYAPVGGIVLDPCMGFGGRLLGVVASGKGLHYVGFDLEPRTVAGGVALATHIGVTDRVDVVHRDLLDDPPWLTADLVFTSPPYFDVEDYNVESPSIDYSTWLDVFLRGLMVRAFKSAPLAIINVARFGVRDLPGDLAVLVQSMGGVVERIIAWPQATFGRAQQVAKEQILVIRRPSTDSKLL